MVKVKYLLLFREKTGKEEEQIQANTIRDLLRTIYKRYTLNRELIFDKSGEIKQYLLIIVNGNRIPMNFIDRKLSESDEVIISTPAGEG